MDQGFRPETKKSFIDTDRCLEMVHRLQILHITDMLAKKSISISRKTEGVFQFRTASQHRTGGKRQLQGKGSIPP
jgi:hypothetical protein